MVTLRLLLSQGVTVRQGPSVAWWALVHYGVDASHGPHPCRSVAIPHAGLQGRNSVGTHWMLSSPKPKAVMSHKKRASKLRAPTEEVLGSCYQH